MKHQYQMFNPATKRYEVIDLDEAELTPGDIVMRLYFSPVFGKYVSIPGATIHRVNENLELELVKED